MSALCSHRGISQASRAGSDHGQVFGAGAWLVVEDRFTTCSWIDQATDLAVTAKGMVETGLVACDAGVDFIFTPFAGFVHQLRIRQHRPGHGDQISLSAGQHGLGYARHVDAVAGDHGHAYDLAQASSDFGKRRAGHHGGNGGHGCFVPAKVRADDVGAGRFNGLGQGDDFFPRHAALQHVHGRNAKDKDKLGAYRGAYPTYYFYSKPHAVLKRTAPLICT